ncbi:MFS transporter [Variovorax beijingensis]|uniref:MFS transporter n=1 Tax=Variovorax beijingensis TaxID=2496117 RepID=A0ABY0ACU6_9BURK|nr:MFS transporter [Variovorax beijingensis]RSZ42925.1 MFS transporter [Variovorax beijingensis]
MFLSESGYRQEQRGGGTPPALAYFADINQYTRLYGIQEGEIPRRQGEPKPTRKEKLEQQKLARPQLYGMRTLFDFNEHFIELSNAEEEKRSLGFMLLLLGALILSVPVFGVTTHFLRQGVLDWVLCLMAIGVFALEYFFLWPYFLAPAFFTGLRARYRFNRTTRKVYALRPKKYGGNVVLDWNRVQAHVRWAPPKSWTAEQLATSEAAREERLRSAGLDSNLLLYWPPLDTNDPERKGEDVLWVGPTGSGESLWQYIRTFMEDGMHAVPPPSKHEWLRKGFSGPSEHLEETVMHGSHMRDDIIGKGTSGATFTNYATNFLWAPLHSLAERLCYWPTFPEEWNSDCGQKRRESGIGPEEPLRWTCKP